MSTKIKVKITAFNKDLNNFGKKISSTCDNLVETYANEIKENSGEQCPVDTGSLKDSRYTEITNDSNVKKAIIGYGGSRDKYNPKSHAYASEYAYVVHESLYAHHRVGKAKFLEDPSNEFAQKLPSKIAKDLSEV